MADSFDFRDMLMDSSIPFEQIPFEGIVFGNLYTLTPIPITIKIINIIVT